MRITGIKNEIHSSGVVDIKLGSQVLRLFICLWLVGTQARFAGLGVQCEGEPVDRISRDS